MEQEKIARILLIIFYALSLATLISYFGSDRTIFYYFGGAAIATRLIHYFMKFFM